MKQQPGQDLRHLPDHAFGHRMPIWWGTIGFMVIEGSGFVMTIAAFFYLAGQNPDWPAVPKLPSPWIGTLLALFLLATELPNFWVKRSIKRFDLRGTRLGMLVMSGVGLVAVAIRGFEFGALNCRWDTNAFGSLIWALIFLHTSHIVVDVAETCVMTAMVYIGPLEARRFVDLSENAEYWDFVVLTWIPVYAVIYWVPRWLAT
jgi:heme/copper-type cytochrome/quinol oxidase subunit 3